MLGAVQTANLAVRFLIEVVLLVSVAAWAWAVIQNVGLRVAGTVALPLLLAVVWVAMVHGDGVPGWVSGTSQVVILGAGLLALTAVSTPMVGVITLAVVVVNAALLLVWGQ